MGLQVINNMLTGLRARLKKLKLRYLVLALLVLALAFGAYKAWRLWKLAQSLQTRLDQLQAVADGGDEVELRDLKEVVSGAHADLKSLRREVAFVLPLTPHLGWVPKVGGDLQAAPALLDVALAVTEAGTLALDGLDPLLDLAEGEGEGEPLAVVAETLRDAQPQLQAAEEELTWANQRWDEIDQSTLSDRTAGLLGRFDDYLPLAETAVKAGQLAPAWLGVEGRRTYLILAQNSDELRASGGFISAVGTLTLENGQIAELSFEDSYAVDDFSYPYPDPPPAYPRYMNIELWVFRDANWWPDFPTSAQAAVDLYRISRDLEVDGVLAVDPGALQAIVSALAPLEVEGWPEAVTGDNVMSLIQMAWSPDLEVDKEGKKTGFDPQWWRQRKNFISDLVGAMRAKVEGSPGEVDWLALAKALLRSLDERHVQMWLSDESNPAAQLLNEQGWDGALRQTDGDYLMVVDANLGYNKVNALIQQRLNYQVEIGAEGSAQATLTVRHVNPSSGEAACQHKSRYGTDYADIVNRCYWNYMRVYAPAGARLDSATRHPVEADLLVSGQAQSGEAETLPPESGKTVFASFFVLPRGEETETRFVYQLPDLTLERCGGEDKGELWCYRLWVQKQAGTEAVPLRVGLTLPPGALVETLDPTGRRPEPNQVVWEADLKQDRAFEVRFRFAEERKGGAND